MKYRRAGRKESSLSAEVYTRKDVIAANAENVSDCGVCLKVHGELSREEIVGVSMFPVDDGIEDPDAEPVNVPAKVIWCDERSGPGILAGMRFVEEE